MTWPHLIQIGAGSAGSVGAPPYRLHPDLWLWIHLDKFPTSEGIQILEYAVTGMADPGSFKQGSLLELSRFQRTSMDPDGNFQIATVKAVLDDSTGELRQMLVSGQPTEYFLNREAAVYSLSPEGRAIGREPVVCARGWISDIQPMSGRRVSLEFTDVLGSQMSRTFLDQPVGLTIGDEHGATLPSGNRGKMYPILGGEATDYQSFDAEGNPSGLGVLGVIECHTTIVPVSASQTFPTEDDPDSIEITLYSEQASVLAIDDDVSAGNIGEQVWCMVVFAQNGHAVTQPITLSTNVTTPGTFTHAISVYIDQATAVSNTAIASADEVWAWLWTNSQFAFDPFTKPTADAGTKVAFINIANTPDGPHSVPGGGTSDFRIQFTALPGAPWVPSPIAVIDPPEITSGLVAGTPGSTRRYYRVTALTDRGESIGSETFIVENTAESLTSIDRVDLDGTMSIGTSGIRVYMGYSANANRLVGGFSTSTSDTSWSFSHQDNIETMISPPSTNEALENPDAWTFMLVCIGAIAAIPRIYGTDRAIGDEPKRVLQDEFYFGPTGEILAPGHNGWPFSTNYVIIGGIQQTGIYVRGEILKAHRDRKVTISVDFCGPESVGDSTGLVIDGAFRWLLWLIDNMVLRNSGTGYRRGNWFTPDLERYSNGEAICDTAAFEACQQLSALWLGNVLGYKIRAMITEQITLRELLRKFCATFGCQISATRRGCIRPFFIDDEADPDSGLLLRYPIEASGIEGDPKLAWDETQNRIEALYDWRADFQGFFGKAEIEDETAIAAAIPGTDIGDDERRGVIVAKRDMAYTADAATVTDVLSREIVRRRRPPQYITLVTDMYGLNTEIGEQVRYAHPDRISEFPNADFTDTVYYSRGKVVGHGIDPLLRYVYITIRDTTAVHPIQNLSQQMPITETDENAPLVTDTDSLAPLVLL